MVLEPTCDKSQRSITDFKGSLYRVAGGVHGESEDDSEAPSSD